MGIGLGKCFVWRGDIKEGPKYKSRLTTDWEKHKIDNRSYKPDFVNVNSRPFENRKMFTMG